MTDKPKLEAEAFDWCHGITSKVKDKEQLLMLDLDDTDIDRVIDIVEHHLPDGLYVIQRSSENSYNVVSLTTVPRIYAIENKASIYEDDAEHLKIGIDREKWITRLSAKGDKPRPEFVGLIEVIDDNHDRPHNPLSKLHMELFIELYDGLYDVMPEISQYPIIEGSVETVKYPSLAEKEHSLGDLLRYE